MLKTKNHKIHINYFIEKRLAYQQPPENREPQAETAKPAKEAFKEIEEAVKALEKAKGKRKELIERVSDLLGSASARYFSAELLTALARYSELRELIYNHPYTPEKVRVDLLKDPKIRLKRLLRVIAQYKGGDDPELLRAVYDPDPNIRVLARRWVKAGKPDPELIAESWLNPTEKAAAGSDTKETLTALSNHPDYSVRCAVADNPFTPPASLAKLAMDSNAIVRSVVASNPYTPHDLLNKLSNDKNIAVLSALSENPSTPTATLEKVYFKDPAYLSAYIARNPNAPSSILGKLAGHKDIEVRANVAGNPNTPQDILVQLTDDKSIYIADEAVNNPSFPANLKELVQEKLNRRRHEENQ